MDKKFLRRVNDIEFHYDSYLRGYFIIPLEEIKIIHTTIAFTQFKIFPTVYLKLLGSISKYLETVIITTRDLNEEGDVVRKFIVVGENSVNHLVINFFNALYQALERYIHKLRLIHRSESIASRKKGKKVKGHFRKEASMLRKQYIEYACTSINKLLDLKEKLPRKQPKSIKLSAIQYYINNTIPIKGNKHRLYARK